MSPIQIASPMPPQSEVSMEAGAKVLSGSTEGKQRIAVREFCSNVAGYAAAVILTLVLVTVALQLWDADFTVPFRYGGGDGMLNLMLIKSTLDGGWYLDNDRLGAPDGQNLRDFPMPDALHFGVIKLLGRVFMDPAVVANLFFLLPFPLTALTSYFALRRFKLDRLPALVASVLYACAPYHFWRMIGHTMLAAYYLLPLSTWIIARICQGRSPFLQTISDAGKMRWSVWNWEAVGAIFVCALTGIAGVYYAFFTCFFLLGAGVKAAFQYRQWRHVGPAAALILVVASTCGAALAPNILYRAQHGKNHEAGARSPYEADFYSLNVSEMLLPIQWHRIPALARIHDRYLLPPRSPSGESPSMSPLGLAASVGFLWLVGRFLWRRRENENRVEDALAYLTVAAVALGTIGGFGASFNFYVMPMIRCYNRLSIYIAFFALAGLFLMVQRLTRRYVTGRSGFAAYAVALWAVLLVGAFDQTVPQFIPNYVEAKNLYAADAEFGKRMEAMLPPGAMVYQLPYVRFPESVPIHQLMDYELLRPFLHTRSLRWSYGAIKGRESSRRQAALAERPLAESLPELARRGFSGVYIDRAGFDDNGAAVERELTRLLGVVPQVSQSGQQGFFDMTAYTQAHRGLVNRLP
jgi:hypothetical protein